jgi:hypothetical protein
VSSWSSWAEPVPIGVDPMTLRIQTARPQDLMPAASAPTSAAPAPVSIADPTAYWSWRAERITVIAGANAHEAAMAGLAPEVVHAVWVAAGQALIVLDDATLAIYGPWYARQAGEQAAAWMAAWQQAASWSTEGCRP